MAAYSIFFRVMHMLKIIHPVYCGIDEALISKLLVKRKNIQNHRGNYLFM